MLPNFQHMIWIVKTEGIVEGKTRECREKHISTWAREASSWFENHRDQGTDRGRIETFC